MPDFPTVGLTVDLTGIQQGEAAYDGLAKKIDTVGLAAEAASKKVSAAAAADVRATEARATAVEVAAKRAEAAQAAEIKQAIANYNYLQRVQAGSAGQTPWYVKQAQEFAAAQEQQAVAARAAAAAREQVFTALNEKEVAAIERTVGLEMRARERGVASARVGAAEQALAYEALSDKIVSAMERAALLEMQGKERVVASTQAATAAQAALYDALSDREVAAMERALAFEMAANEKRVQSAEVSLSAITARDLKMWAARREAAVAGQAAIDKVIDDALRFADTQYAKSVAAQAARAQAAAAATAQDRAEVRGVSAPAQMAEQIAATEAALRAQAKATAEVTAAQVAQNTAMSEADALRAKLRADMLAQVEVETGVVAVTEAATVAIVAQAAALSETNRGLEQAVTKYMAAGATVKDVEKAFAGNAAAMALANKIALESGIGMEDAAARADKLKAQFDSVFAAQQKLNAVTKEANALRAAGDLTGAEEASILKNATSEYLHAAGSVGGLSLKVREFLVILRELSRGDMTRLAGSASILAQAFGLITVALLQTVAIVAAAAAPFIVFGLVLRAAEKQLDDFNNAVKATGGYAGVSFGQIQQMSEGVAQSTNNTVSSVEKTMQAVVASGKVGGESLAVVTEASTRLADLTGQKTQEVAGKLVGFYGNASKKALELNESVHFLTAGTYGQIEALERAGDQAGAFDLAMKTLNDELESRGNPQMDSLNSHLHDIHTWMDSVLQDFDRWVRLLDGVSTGIDKIKDAHAGLARHPASMSPGETASHLVPTASNIRDSLDIFLGHNRAYYRQELQVGTAQQQQSDADAAAKEAARKQSDRALHGVTEMESTMGRLRLGDPTYIRQQQDSFWAGVDAARTDKTTTKDQRDEIQWADAHRAEINADIAKRFTRQAAHGPQDQSDRVADAARLDEEKAQLAITGDLALRAKIGHDEVRTELAVQQARLLEQRHRGSITQSAYEAAMTANEAAARSKDRLVDLQKQEALDNRALAQKQALAGYADREGAARQQMAKNAAEQNAFDDAALKRRQDLEIADLENTKAHQQARNDQAGADLTQEKIDAAKKAQLSETELQAWKDQIRQIDETTAHLNSGLQNQIDILGAQASLSHSTAAQAAVAEQILRLQHQQQVNEAQRVIGTLPKDSQAQKDAIERLKTLKIVQASEEKVAEENTRLVNATQEASDAMGTFKNAIASHNWAQAFNSLMQTIDALQAAFSAQLGGGLGRGLAVTGSVLGAAIGGRGGNALATGLGVYGLTTGVGGYLAGGALAGSVGTALGGGAAAAGVANGITGVGLAMTNPFTAAAVAVVAGLFALGVFDKKPSNNAGIAQIDMANNTIRAVSSGKETQQTTDAANKTAQAILDGQNLLKTLGVMFSKTVSAVDLGTRDKTRIVMSDGSEFRTGKVGDPVEAANAALKAVLDNATFVDAAEKQLVTSMEAAGKGFDDIATSLQKYADAQKLSASLAAQILQLKDPKAYALQQVDTAFADQQKAAIALKDQGFLTADQLSAVNGQLNELKGLQINEVMKQFAAATTSAADLLTKHNTLMVQLLRLQGDTVGATALERQTALAALDPSLRDLQQSIWTLTDAADALAKKDQELTAIRSRVQAAYQAEASTLQTTISTLTQTIAGLDQFKQSLVSGDISGKGPADLYGLRLAALSRASNDNLPQAGQDFLVIAKQQAQTALQYATDVAKVRLATEAARSAAQGQLDVAHQQLTALNAIAAGVVDLNGSVESFAHAMAAWTAGLASIPAGMTVKDPQWGDVKNMAANRALASATGYGGAFGAGGFQAFITHASEDVKAQARGVLHAYNQDARISFATGGSVEVGGGFSADSKTLTMAVAPHEVVNVERPGQSERLAAAVETLGRDIAGLRQEQFALGMQISKNTGQSATLDRKWDNDGLPETRKVAA